MSSAMVDRPMAPESSCCSMAINNPGEFDRGSSYFANGRTIEAGGKPIMEMDDAHAILEIDASDARR